MFIKKIKKKKPREWEKILENHMYPIKYLYPEYIKNLYSSTMKSQVTQFKKMGK